ncbi:MAG TPA: cbb3-type cytochrome c oxidase subunit I, partial [Methylomirabilota bacterium]|nr:cbb3-type cytochrome c oxidase subunit I [Methylomirabilota bacterium]
RAFDWPFFDPTRGGDPLLWQHLFWLFGHPEVYIIFVPAAGLLSTMIPVLSRHPLIGYAWIVASLVALAFLSFGLWVHHMFTVGIPHLSLAFFSAASMLVTVPQAVQIFAWIGTMALGRPRLTTPMLYILGFFFVFVVGGLTGVMVAAVPFDWQAHDSHFVVAHLHYVLIGGFVFPMLAAAYYWLPHFTGRRSMYGVGRTAFWLIFIGMNVTFLIMHLTGLRGMPRRVYTYSEGLGWTDFNLISSIGGFIMTIGFALVAIDLLLQPFLGKPIRRDPWRAETLEWAIATPPTSYGFGSLPDVDGRAPLQADRTLPARLAAGDGYLGFARNGWPETLAVDAVTGRPDHVVILPQPTILPLVSALATGVFFLAMLFKLYWLAPVGIVLTVGVLLSWTRTTGGDADLGPLPVGRGQHLPPHFEAERPPSWWAMLFVLIANGALFASLAFGLLFLWLVAPGWPPAAAIDGGHAPFTVILGGAALASMAGHRATIRAREEDSGGVWPLVAAFGQSLAAAAAVWTMFSALPAPTDHAFGALVNALVAYAGIHAAVGCLFGVYGWWRQRSGRVTALRTLDLRIGSMWQDYTLAAAAAVAVLVLGVGGMAAS